jgi:GNAT superfamily N-acetyltransferase
MILVRRAEPADVPAMSRVMIASITELCHGDHRGNAEIIAGWTANKTPESVATWVESPNLLVLVADLEGAIASVGCLNTPDEIGLNYVSPAFRSRGVSKAMLVALENAMREQGTSLGRLTSTQTAHGFYLAMGWEDAGPPETCHNVPGFPMRKRLRP